MAVGAILGDRLVLPKEWSAQFLVAAQAVVIDRDLVQVCAGAGAMGVVAIRAGGLAFQNRVSRWQAHLRLHPLVAVQAHVHAHLAIASGVALLMGIMAAVAGQSLDFVLAARPHQVLAAFVAAQAGAAALLRGTEPAGSEAGIRCRSRRALGVVLTGPVAGFAAKIYNTTF